MLGLSITQVAVGALLILAAVTVGVTRWQLNDCRADLAQFKAAYEQLARSVRAQNDAVLALEKKSAETARRAAQARAQAGKATEVAQRHADALAGFLGASGTCSDGIKVVRDDLRSQQTP
jgi:low affinity Fe/Cu permease